MKCKFCGARIEKGVTVCPACEKDLTKETKPVKENKAKKNSAKVKKNRKGLKLGLAITGISLLAVILTGAVLHFTGVINFGKLFGEQDIFYKKIYSVSKEKAERKGKLVVATMGDQTLTNSELQIHYWNTVSEFIEQNGGYYGSQAVKTLTGMDPEVTLYEQVYDQTTGKTYEQWFLENAIESWRRQAALVQMAKEAGFQMTAEQQNAVDNMAESVKTAAQEAGYSDAEAYVDYYYPGSSLEGYVSYNILSLKAMFYYDSLYESLLPTYEELEAYYAQNEAKFQQSGIAKEDGLYYNIRQIFVPVTSDHDEMGENSVYTEAEWELCRKAAQQIMDDFVTDGGTEELFAERAKEVSADDYKAVGGLHEYLSKHNAEYGEEFLQWYTSADRKAGDVGLVKCTESASQGYYVLFFCKSYAIWEYHANLIVPDERAAASVQGAITKWPVEVKYSKIVLGSKEYPEKTTAST